MNIDIPKRFLLVSIIYAVIYLAGILMIPTGWLNVCSVSTVQAVKGWDNIVTIFLFTICLTAMINPLTNCVTIYIWMLFKILWPVTQLFPAMQVIFECMLCYSFSHFVCFKYNIIVLKSISQKYDCGNSQDERVYKHTMCIRIWVMWIQY